MSRLVTPVPQGAAFTSANRGGDYAERVAKYVPGEILAAYLSINGILASVVGGNSAVTLGAYIASFILCLVLTPVYLRSLAAPGEPKRTHSVLSTIAFVIWAYNLGGLFAALEVHIPWLGAIALVAFSLVSGSVAPRAGDP